MNERTDLDRLLTAWLTADAPIREPEPLLGVILARTARTRRRAAWRIPERWFPVSTITTRVAGASRFPWRTVGVIALLVLALAVGAVLIVGSRGKPVPAPFGPAGNGHIAYSVNGDILTADSPTGTPRALIAGATFDSGPVYSPDGSRFIFIRGQMDSTAAEMWVAGADGANPRRLAATPNIGWAEWSPRSDVVAVSLDGDRSVVRMVKTDGSGYTDIKTGLNAADNPIFRPSDGGQVAFRGMSTDGTWGIYMIDRDGANMQRLDLDPGFATDPEYAVNSDNYFYGPTWSPDGTRLLYYTLEPDPESPAGPGFRVHLADVSAAGAVTHDKKLEFARTADDEFAPGWLPSGTGIIYQSVDGSTHREFVVDLSAGSLPRDLGVIGSDYIGTVISPDGRQVVLSVPSAASDKPTSLAVDLTTLATTPLATGGDDLVWQRTAQ